MTRLGARLLESRNTTSPFAFQPSTFVRRRPLPATTVFFNRSVSKDTEPHAEPRCRRRYPLAEPLITSMASRGRIPTGLFNLIMHFLGDEKRTSPLQVDRIRAQRADGNSASGCVYYLLVSSTWIPMSRCCCYLSRLSKHTKADMTQMKHPRGSLSQPFDVKKMSQKKKTYVPSSPMFPKKHRHQNATVDTTTSLTSARHTATLRTPLGWRWSIGPAPLPRGVGFSRACVPEKGRGTLMAEALVR